MLKISLGGSLAGDTAVYLFSNILNAAIPFILLPILTRYLGPHEYGKVAMFQTLLGALSAFVGLSVAGAATRKYYDRNINDHEFKIFIATCLQILLVSSGLVFLIMAIFGQKLTAWLGLQTNWAQLAVFISTVSVVIQLRLTQWQIRKRARQYGILQVLQSIFNMALSLLLIVILLIGAEGRIIAQVWTAGIFAVLALFLLKRDGLLGFFFWRPGYLREVLAFGVPLIPHVTGMFLLSSVDRFFINAKLGLSEAGIYMIAVQLTGAMGLVYDAINKAYVPWLFERLNRGKREEKRQIVQYTYAWFAINLIMAGLAFIIGPWLVTQIAGENFARAGEVIGWLALGQAFAGMYLMVTNYIFYSKRTGLLSLFTITSGLINVMLLIVLIETFGFKGAAIASAIAMAIRFILTWWLAQRSHPMPWFDL